uniref:ATP-dependent Clp protease proteolytic subunit n=1 Tax=Duranta erecta TaxID=167917 RepID=A0A8A0WU85_DURER|nr:ATP-dependent Clp protease proteolytic subunit 1 [Duranta erecta]QSQ72421.1 ATP-dependent Clp protease proteolytic subunit 1 [Duranta erecta]
MPVGVPKVPFRVPGDDDASWVTLLNRLYRDRVLFLTEEIDSENSNQLVSLIVYLTLEDKGKDLFVLINSPGGGVIYGMAIYDIMQVVPQNVHTICFGIAASMACLILTGGTISKRTAFPHARVMMHQPASSFFEGYASDVFMETGELKKIRDSIKEIYTERTYRLPWDVEVDLDRDSFMPATTALDYGIIDQIGLGF